MSPARGLCKLCCEKFHPSQARQQIQKIDTPPPLGASCQIVAVIDALRIT
jgi:hypothetical protein